MRFWDQSGSRRTLFKLVGFNEDLKDSRSHSEEIIEMSIKILGRNEKLVGIAVHCCTFFEIPGDERTFVHRGHFNVTENLESLPRNPENSNFLFFFFFFFKTSNLR